MSVRCCRESMQKSRNERKRNEQSFRKFSVYIHALFIINLNVARGMLLNKYSLKTTYYLKYFDIMKCLPDN